MSGIFLRKHYLWAIYNEIHLVKYWRDPMGTQCYLVNPRSAKRLLEKSTLIQVPVDDFIGDYALHKLNVVGCKNYPVLHDISIPSQLGNRHKKKYFTLAGKVYRELYLQTRNIKKLLVQVSFFILAQLRNKNAN
jgi:GR25 family glycosyltransferase involved in LPS biosynthesis